MLRESVKDRGDLLIQEWYLPNLWRHFVCCIFLNQTQGVQVQEVCDEFFEACPDPYAAAHLDREETLDTIRTLGLYNRRFDLIVGFSADWIRGKPIEKCHGIGKYALDSYRVLVESYTDDDVTDHMLLKRMETIKKRKH